MKEFEGKKLLLLGGIKVACSIVERAQKMGAYVAVADYNIDSPAKLIADEAVLMDAMNVDAIVKWCKENHIDGVTTGFVDILMPVVYEVCKRLNLPYYATPKMISMSTNKMDFKETCERFDVPVPKTYVIGSKIEENVYDTIDYPVFVKPLDASGSRGAGACYNRKELDAQFADAISYSPTKTAVIEDYITGTEFLLDYVGVDGEFRLLSMFDRYMSSGRSTARNYSNVAICPSKQIKQYYEEANPKILKMFKELGFTDGLIFLQGHTDGRKITFYEMGCRLGGSFFELEQEVLGLDPVEMTVRYALSGKMIESIEKIRLRSAEFPKVAMVANYLLEGDDETVAKIDGIKEVKVLDSYVALIQQRDVGCHYKKDRTVDKPILSFFMTSDDMNGIKETLAFMNKKIEVTNADGKSLLSTKYDPNKL
ncbi:ATP-grasp domain-containing protein [Butyrivibrio fibrisolvens]|uniref:ATP-grasp domain-containing protein n=1 Tax=Butyrivibrio fibrisolvens TaxID=831 RepID=UPI00041064B6|nr:ATP-grasp domain-containing protein [Butyrivibrio fibrisolvens]